MTEETSGFQVDQLEGSVLEMSVNYKETEP